MTEATDSADVLNPIPGVASYPVLYIFHFRSVDSVAPSVYAMMWRNLEKLCGQCLATDKVGASPLFSIDRPSNE
jgi:hypothetical protein